MLKGLFALLLAHNLISLSSAATVDIYTAKNFQNDKGQTQLYRFYAPKNMESGKKYPLMLALHGSGESGSDNTNQLKYAMTNMWADSNIQSKYPGFVIAPQCAVLNGSPVGWKTGLLKGLIDSTLKAFPIDTNRIYVSGLSMGGYGTWALLAAYPNFFAAAVPVCGGGDSSKAKLFKHVPIWAFHGQADNTVPIIQTRMMITALKAAGGDPLFKEYPGVGHNSWENAAKEPGLVDWIYGQNKAVGASIMPLIAISSFPKIKVGFYRNRFQIERNLDNTVKIYSLQGHRL